RTSSQHRLGKRIEKCSKRREQRCQTQDQRSHENRKTVNHSCHRHQSHILAERSQRRAPKAPGNGTGKTVHRQGTSQLFHADIPSQSTGTHSCRRTGSLRRRHQKYYGNGEKGSYIKHRLVTSKKDQLGKTENSHLLNGLRDLGEIYHGGNSCYCKY